MLIGGLWVPWHEELAVRAALLGVRAKHQLRAEMKWTKVSRKMLPAYTDFVNVLFEHCSLRFKCIVLDTHILDYRTFHQGDRELGFYKFYYLLISRNLDYRCQYWLYTDELRNRKSNRLETLQLTVNRWWRKYRADEDPLVHVEPRRSHDDDLIQLNDILLGATAYHWNQHTGSEPKVALAAHIAERLKRPSLRIATRPGATKFNVWKWQPV